jgi:16S rRNA (guanine527-N7)-methyltransferase
VIEALEAAAGRHVSRETFEKLQAYVVLLTEEARRQNLIAASTIEVLWERHILDAAQLVRLETSTTGTWLDIGSGAGLPGVVISCLSGGVVTLAEPRRLRAEFLHRVVESLGLNAMVVCSKAERLTGTFDMITARAVAPLSRLLELSSHLSTGKTTWVLPKGRRAVEELEHARRSWQGEFHVEPSSTDADSRIIVGTGVRRRT